MMGRSKRGLQSLTVLILVAGLCGLVEAQDTPASEPQTAAPTAAPTAEEITPPAEDSLTAPSADGQLVNPQALQAGGLTAAPGESRDEYVIQSGDTLWDISARFFEKPEYWPKLWSYNPYITNPHLIFPNNKLVFRPGTETQPPSVEVQGQGGGLPMEPLAGAEGGETGVPGVPVAEGDAGAAPIADEEMTERLPMAEAQVAEGSEAGRDGNEVVLREDGYISPSREQAVGVIAGAFIGTGDLSENMEVYLKLKTKDPVQVGDLYTVFREEKKVRGIGHLNKILGVVQITSLTEKVVRARILRSYYHMERGDLVRDFYNALHKVNIKEASNPVSGVIIERLNYTSVDIGEGDVVYIDRGNRDGVEPGYQFVVVRRGDGFTGKTESYHPDEVVGALVVVVARGNNSTAVVVKSRDALRVGDRIQTASR